MALLVAALPAAVWGRSRPPARRFRGISALSRRKRRLLGAAALAGCLVMLGVPGTRVQAANNLSCPNGMALNIVAHEDDDLLFLNPAMIHDIQNDRCVTTVSLSAGDNGDPSSYWLTREQGSEDAYAHMAGLPDSWLTTVLHATDSGGNDHPIRMRTLNGDSSISLLFMRLPDGAPDGSGFPWTNNESLQKLWEQTISSIHAVDASTAYTKSQLTEVLTDIINTFKPDIIRTQDFVAALPNNDHSDHVAAAYFANAAQISYSLPHTLSAFIGYGSSNYPQNVTGADLTQKQDVFYAYGLHDSQMDCDSRETCAAQDEAWLERQYTVPWANAGSDRRVSTGATVQLDGSASFDAHNNPLTYSWAQTGGSPDVTLSGADTANPTFTAPTDPATLTFELTVHDGYAISTDSVTVTVVAGMTNIAGQATVKASSENTASYQLAIKAVDGFTDGWPGGNYLHEWATNGEQAGAWLDLAWSRPYRIDQVVLYDRPNLADWIRGATLLFSDGTTVSVPALANNGMPTEVDFPAVLTTSLRLTITSVGPDTHNVGLAEIEVWKMPNSAPVANAGLDQTVNTSEPVTLDGSASSDPDGDTLYYQWTQTGGSTVSLSSNTVASPTFTAPGSATTLVFKLTVSDGTLNNWDTVTVNVPDRAPVANAGLDQTVNTSEPVTLDGSASSDPDLGDTLTYLWRQQSGTSVTLSSNTAKKPTFTAPNRATTLVFKLTVSDGTLTDSDTVTIHVGNRAPVANAGPDQTVNTSEPVTLDGSASSDPDLGDALTYTWEQQSGTAVTLNATDPVKPTFTTPGSATTLVFKLTVSDGTLNDSDTVTITVNNPPVASAGAVAKVQKRLQTKLVDAKILSKKRTAIFTFSGSGGERKLSFECRLDKGKYSSCRSPKTYQHLKHGKHVFQVRAKDATGNVDLTPATKRFKI